MGSCVNSTVSKPVYLVKHPKDLEVSCKICFNTYNSTDRIPMVMSCGHGICSQCLSSLPKSTCPFDRTTIDKGRACKNMEMMELLNEADDKNKKQSQSIVQEPVCQKNHPTVWSGLEKQCKVCLEMSGGWQCLPCDFHMCTKCSGFHRKAKKQCFNSHQTTWRGVPLRCAACQKLNSGWQCNKCSYNYCTSCSRTPKKNDQCPNGHALKWKSTKQMPCQMCGLLELGMTCQECHYRICQKCRPISMQPQKCPNQHPTIWRPIIPNVKCSKCNLESSGYSCRQCGYHLCSVCSRIKHKLAGQEFCPNGHNQIRWERAVICLFKCPNIDGFICQSQECGFAICRRCFGYKPQPKRCPNNHLMPWIRDKQMCLICQNELHGWKCQQCSYFCCSQCSHTVLKGITCPNFHTKTWKPTKQQCLVCPSEDKYGWSCQQCKFFTCDGCQKTNLLDGRCPNGDTLTLSPLENTCLICGNVGRCMECQKCSFFGCFKCLKKKLNRISCPNSHYVKIENCSEVRKCEVCNKFVEEIYECREKCLPVCEACIKWK